MENTEPKPNKLWWGLGLAAAAIAGVWAFKRWQKRQDPYADAPAPTVKSVHIYPVKSCHGITLDSAQVLKTGFRFDRHWMVVDATGRFLTQREYPRMALIQPHLEADHLRLVLPSGEGDAQPIELLIPFAVPEDAPRIAVHVWKSNCVGVDQGPLAAQHLSTFIGTPCKLVCMAPEHTRPVDAKYRVQEYDRVGFADGFPFLITTTASLAAVQQALPAGSSDVGMERFRANIVLDNGTNPKHAWHEDTWTTIQIGNLTLHPCKPCSRCQMTTIDQKSASCPTPGEPLRTLQRIHAQPSGKVYFGMNATHDYASDVSDDQVLGVIRIGDAVRIISTK
eukprot:TRINITY_DN7285_c0_g1_i3.p1 TRINITY_DN7285_c0_g1~~TRINITY_DN7285_c0_g1_i3.p1  ORF type:complete len:336 (+),score=55.82 TRINITY_DN7285_c0_g1_i3:71-1078(+)